MIFIPIILAVLYIALAMMFISLSFIVFLGRKKIKRKINQIKNSSPVKIEIVCSNDSHI